MPCVSNYVYTVLWDMITRPCPNMNVGLTKLSLKLGYEWMITSYTKQPITDSLQNPSEVMLIKHFSWFEAFKHILRGLITDTLKT